MKTIINIRPDGMIETLGDPLPGIGQVVSKRRVSNIYPVNPIKRIAFRALRLCFGEDGQFAAFTRSWSGKWIAVMHNGKRCSPRTRSECLMWEHREIAWMEQIRS